jgi:hypothetical protein
MKLSDGTGCLAHVFENDWRGIVSLHAHVVKVPCQSLPYGPGMLRLETMKKCGVVRLQHASGSQCARC